MTDLVVVGLGYVGLPLVQEACRSGFSVVGLDSSPQVVDGLNDGRSHIDDLSDVEIKQLIAAGFRATTDARVVAEAESIVICVPTPLSADGGPDLTAVRGACESVGEHLAAGSLVVLESTTYPGTTQELVVPTLEEASGLASGNDFHVAYSPERIDPGNATYHFRNTPKVVGADSPEALEAVTALYGRMVDTVVQGKGTREAESAKLLENTYRHVNIALVNEMARFFKDLGVDFWNVIELAGTKPFGFQSFSPGPGVGGHCIPIDPNYLSHRVRAQLGYGFRFVELAQEINSSMPLYVVQRAMELLNDQGKAVRGARVLLLGVTYKPNIADQRESPALEVGERLNALGAHLEYHDPLVEKWSVAAKRITNLEEGVAAADLTILLQDHDAYDSTLLEDHARLLFDTRGKTRGPNVVRL